MKRKSLVASIAALLGCVALPLLAATPNYFVQAVRPAPGATASIGNSINQFGLIAGFSNFADGTTVATAWLYGSVAKLGTLGGANSAVEWPVKNDFGVISGIAQTAHPDPNGESWSCSAFLPATGNTCLGFVWAFGRMYPLDPLPGGHNSFATGTNNRLQTAGWAENGVRDPTCNVHQDSDQVLQFLPVVWGPGTNQIHPLPLLPGDSDGAATAINDRGDVVGISGICDQAVGRETARHMVLWRDGRAVDLGNIGGDAWNTPMAINQRGDVVGFANTVPGTGFHAHAFFRSHTGGPPIDLGVLYPGDTISQALGINDRGQVVGLSCGSSGCRGFLWQDGRMVDLNQLAPGYAGVIEDAQDINNLGQITGQARDAGGNLVSFWAIPVAH